jgi:hypothetical protein
VISRLFIEPRFSCFDYDVLSGLGVKAKQNSTTEDEEEAVSEVSYSLFRSTFHRTVILGDPGGGKSTTIQNLCFEFSKALSLAVEYPNRDDTDPFRQRMPLRVVLRALESRHTSNRSLTILDFIIDEISELVDEPRQVLEQFIRYSLATGTAIVLFDGLDEVLNVGSRRSYVGIVEQFSHQFPATGVLVTSRYVGYMDAPLSPDFQCLALARFKESEIEQYTRKLLSVVKVAKEKSLDSEVQSFLTQTSRNARDLRENPLMLALMVWLFAMKGDVPANRPEIYKECATLMFERWDPNRGILADIPTDFELLDLFGFVAHEILGKPELEEGVTREWLLSKMQTYFVRWYEDKAKAHATASSLVGFLVGRAWVMSEVGAGLFKFTHRTFLEYFYAKYMNAQVDSVKELVSRLKHRIYSVQLDVVNHLSLQMFTFREPRKIHEAAVELTKIVEENVTPFEVSNALNFFSRSLEYLMMSEQQFKASVEVMCAKMIDVGSTGETYVAQTLVHLCANSGARLPIVVEVAKKVLTKAIRKKDEASLEFIVNTLIGGRVRRRDKPSFVTRIHSRSYISLMNELKLEFLREIASRAKREVRLAALSAQLDPDLLPSLYQDHGAELLLVNWKTNIISIAIGLPAVLRTLGAQAGLMLPDVPWVAANSKTLGDFFLKLLEDGFIKLLVLQSFEFGRDITLLLRRVFQPSPLASGLGVIIGTAGLSRGVVLSTSAAGPSVVLATSAPGRGIVQSTSTLGRFRQISDHGALGAFFLGIAVLCELEHALAPSDTSRSIRRADLILQRRKELILKSIPPNARHKFVDSARKWAQPGSAGLIEHRTVG